MNIKMCSLTVLARMTGYEKRLSLKSIKLVQSSGSGIFREDSMTIRVMMKAEPPHFNSTVSKLVTGYVGIKNRGTTCYLNSVLQTLFFITKFRNACAANTENDGYCQLKDVFNEMSVSESARVWLDIRRLICATGRAEDIPVADW